MLEDRFLVLLSAMHLITLDEKLIGGDEISESYFDFVGGTINFTKSRSL